MSDHAHLVRTAEQLAETLNSGVDDGCVMSILEDAFPECLEDNDWPISFRLDDGSLVETVDSFYDAAVVVLRRDGTEVRVVWDAASERWSVVADA